MVLLDTQVLQPTPLLHAAEFHLFLVCSAVFDMLLFIDDEPFEMQTLFGSS